MTVPNRSRSSSYECVQDLELDWISVCGSLCSNGLRLWGVHSYMHIDLYIYIYRY